MKNFLFSPPTRFGKRYHKEVQEAEDIHCFLDSTLLTLNKSGSEIDFSSRYLEHICKFIGISEVHHIDASGSKSTPEQVIAQGKQQVNALISTISTLTGNDISGAT